MDAIEDLLARVDAGELGDPLPILAYLAGQEVEVPDEEYPFFLTTGRVHFHYHTGTMTRRSPTLNREMAAAAADINPADAEALGIKSRDMMKVSSRRGEVKIRARVTTSVPPGTIFIPFNFRESAANALTISARDPVSKIPEFKVCAVKIEKAVGRRVGV